MERIFESSGSALLPASEKFAAWIAAQVEDIGKHCSPDERPVLRAYRRGQEYLAYDYPSLSITIRIDPAYPLQINGPLTCDVTVPDMTDALTLISLIEQARQGTESPIMVVGTFVSKSS